MQMVQKFEAVSIEYYMSSPSPRGQGTSAPDDAMRDDLRNLAGKADALFQEV